MFHLTDPQSILVVPYWSQSDAVNFDSNYSFLRQTIPEISKIKSEWLFFVLWPETRSGADVWRYTSDGFWNDKIIPVRWPYDTSRSSSILSFNARKFQEIDETYCPTVYWLHQPVHRTNWTLRPLRECEPENLLQSSVEEMALRDMLL